ncbi:flagellin domain-containing protein, partial [Hylemonella gracilis ATCC 19624]
MAATANARTSVYGNNQAINSATNAQTVASGATWGANGISSEAFTINAAAGSAAITVTANETAQSVATKVNQQTSVTGVTADARADAQLSFGATGAYTLQLRSDNSTAEAITFNLTDSSNTPSGLAAAIS